MTLIIIGIIIMVVSFIAALFNMANDLGTDSVGSWGSMFKRHALFGSGIVIGFAVAAIGILLLVA